MVFRYRHPLATYGSKSGNLGRVCNPRRIDTSPRGIFGSLCFRVMDEMICLAEERVKQPAFGFSSTARKRSHTLSEALFNSVPSGTQVIIAIIVVINATTAVMVTVQYLCLKSESQAEAQTLLNVTKATVCTKKQKGRSEARETAIDSWTASWGRKEKRRSQMETVPVLCIKRKGAEGMKKESGVNFYS